MDMRLRVEVKYNSYLDDVEVGDMTCEAFDSFVEFCEHVIAVKRIVPMQLKHDPQYTDIHEARVNIFVNGDRVATINYRRASYDLRVIQESMSGSLITV